MSGITTLIGEGFNNNRQLIVWSDPLQTIYSSFMRGSKKKVSLDELMEKERKETDKLMKSIFKMLKELARSPIDEVELLMILLALHKTGDVVKIMWRRTAKGQAIKETYVKAKEAFLRNGLINEP